MELKYRSTRECEILSKQDTGCDPGDALCNSVLPDQFTKPKLHVGTTLGQWSLVGAERMVRDDDGSRH